MAPHSSTLAWKIPRMENPSGLQSMGSLGVGHDWATSLSRTGEGNGNPLQCSCLENPRDRGAWWAAAHWGRYESDTTERLHFHALEKEMATHSSVLAWRIPGTGKPGGLPSMGSHRVRHDWSDLAAAAAAAPLVDFCFCCLCFRCHTPKIVAKTNVKELFSHAFFWSFYHVGSSI